MSWWRRQAVSALQSGCNWLEPALAVALPICGAATVLSPDPDDTPPLGSKTPWIYAGLGCSVVLVLVKGVAARLNAVAKRTAADQMRRAVLAVLNHMHGHFFEQEEAAERWKHRITLFRRLAGRGGPGGCDQWLAVYARKGDNPLSETVWQIDDHNPAKCRGVAGEVWVHSTTSYKRAACDWPEGDDAATKEVYAQSLRCTFAEAERWAVKSQYFAGAMIEVGAVRWGVLLIDSLRDFHKLPSSAQHTIQKKRLERYATLIGTLLREGES